LLIGGSLVGIASWPGGRGSFLLVRKRVASRQRKRTVSETTQSERIRFDDFEANFSRGELRKHGVRLKVHDQPFQVLAMLAARPGEVVTREELQQKLWPTGTFVDFENSLNSAVNRLRDVLGDSAEEPKFIETVPRHGYRFLISVERLNGIAPPIAAKRDEPSVGSTGRPHTWNRLAAVSVAVAAACLSYFLASATPFITRFAVHVPHSLFVVVSTGDQDVNSEILTEGASEAVVRTLKQSGHLRVIVEHSPLSRSEALSVAQTLKCDALLAIQGERQGDRFQVRIETSNLSTGDSVWEETITGRVADAVWIDSSASDVVARRFNGSNPRAKLRPTNSAAFQEYLRGRYFWNKRNPRDLEEAFASFRAAIHDDPQFAPAYAGLAQTYVVADIHDPRVYQNEETYREAREAARHAIAIDADLASGHLALAQIFRNHDRDMLLAEREYRKAIELDPTDATAHQWYAEFLAINGQVTDAISEVDRAHELDPLSAVVAAVCGTIRIEARRYEESLPFADEALRLDPHYYSIYNNIAAAKEGQGRYLEALDAKAKQAEVWGNPVAITAVREEKAVFFEKGVRGLLRERLRRAIEQATPAQGQYAIARYYCQLGDVTHCLDALEKALSEHGEGVTDILINPGFDNARGNARFNALAVRFGFTPNLVSQSR
jgi:DNA-binding winged helix-turn-helix (wHTH) protein/tetratricopeptide (TPR) repeat protein